MEKRKYTLEELEQVCIQINKSTYLSDIWELRDSFLALKPEDYSISFAAFGVFNVHIMAGRLAEAKKVVDNFNIPGFELYMRIILPTITDEEFIDIVKSLYSQGRTMEGSLTLTAGRPSILNGFRDFTGIDSYLETNKEKTLSALYTLYNKSAESIYELELAERCYQQNRSLESMVKITAQIPILEKNGDVRCLFVALAHQLKLLIMSGQAKSAEILVKDLRERVSKEKNSELIYNIDALEVIVAIYEGNYDLVSDWLEHRAPDEHADFCMLDLYRYMAKIRCYLLTGKSMAVFALSEKLRPLLEEARRYMDLCEMDLLVAMCTFLYGNKKDAYEPLERALVIAQNRQFLRMIGDEGGVMLKLLHEYKKENPNSRFIPFVDEVMEIARQVLVIYPNYLVLPYKQTVSFSEMESSILSLLGQGKTYEQIADVFMISVNTIRYHVKKIYGKLGANCVSEAIYNAKKMGVI